MSLQNISGARNTRCDMEVYSLTGERETPPQKFLEVLTRAWLSLCSSIHKHHRRTTQFGMKLRELSFPQKPACKPFSRSPSSPLQCVEDTAVLPGFGLGGCFKQTGFSGWMHPVQGPWLNPKIGWRKREICLMDSPRVLDAFAMVFLLYRLLLSLKGIILMTCLTLYHLFCVYTHVEVGEQLGGVDFLFLPLDPQDWTQMSG